MLNIQRAGPTVRPGPKAHAQPGIFAKPEARTQGASLMPCSRDAVTMHYVSAAGLLQKAAGRAVTGWALAGLLEIFVASLINNFLCPSKICQNRNFGTYNKFIDRYRHYENVKILR